MNKLKQAVLTLGATLALSAPIATPAFAADDCRIAWSHYTTWELAGWLEDTGRAKVWGDKYGVNLEYVYVGDYIESINLYSAGEFQGVTVTNMDALTIPAASGIDTTVVVAIDFSAGGDGIIVTDPDIKTAKDLKGKSVGLVEFSVSHYAFAKYLEANGMSERDVKVVHVSDADIGSLIASGTGSHAAYVTWNPILMTALNNVPGARLLFDSSEIPGHIIDNVMVNTGASEACKNAVADSYYEALSVMSSGGAEANAMIEFVADQAGSTVAEYEAMVRKTRMFYDPAQAVAFVRSDVLQGTMASVAQFSFDQGLYGDGAPNEKFVGIEYPDGTVWGDQNNVKLRWTDTYMQRVADANAERAAD